MRLTIIAVLAASLAAQDVSVVMSYQGHEALGLLLQKRKLARRAGPVGIINVTACNDGTSAIKLPSARIDQQIERDGTVVIAGPLVAAMLQRRDAADWKRITLEAIKFAAFGVSIWAAQNPEAGIRGLRIAAPAAALSLQQVSDRLAKDAHPLLVQSILPMLAARDMEMEPGGCAQLMRIAQWGAGRPAVSQFAIRAK